MGEVLIANEAIPAGAVTRHALRRWYRQLYPGVYVPKRAELSLRDRTRGAWMWSKRKAVVTGVAASALHGARWVDADVAIELRLNCTRPPKGIVARNDTLADDEITTVANLPVTTPARTAYDLGRNLPRGQALARLDALMRATPFSLEDVALLVKRYQGARGIRQLRELLPLVNGGAESPKESWLRLLLIDAGFPRPTTQIPVTEGWQLTAMLDMGWEEFNVAAEYDGDWHRTDRIRYVKDQRRTRKLAGMGWINIRVIAEDRRHEIIGRVHDALVSRGWQP